MTQHTDAAPEDRIGALTDKFLSDGQVKYYREQALAAGKKDGTTGKERHVPDKFYGHGLVEEGYYIGYDQAAKPMLHSLADMEEEGKREAAKQNLHVALTGKKGKWI